MTNSTSRYDYIKEIKVKYGEARLSVPLHEGITQQVFYYNTKRIHTTLKMSPAAYAATLKTKAKGSDRVLQKVRG